MLNLTYALKNGQLTHISEVQKGIKCGCKCPACGAELIARKGDIMMHHFAHRSKEECEYGYQTTLHLIAKKIISENRIVRVPSLYVKFSGSGKKELIEKEKIVNVSAVILEKKLDNIIPDILLLTDAGKIIVEIYVTHEIDSKKKEKIKQLGVPTLEIDLSKIDREISEAELKEVLINNNKYKTWIYDGRREDVYRKFLQVSEEKEIVMRNYALQIDDCPIKKRIWKNKSYANLIDDCYGCEYFITDKKGDVQSIFCSGKNRIAHISDFEIPTEERIQNDNEKREEEFYDSIVSGICPQCGCKLVIRNGKYGEFFGCSNYPHCRFTFSYDE